MKDPDVCLVLQSVVDRMDDLINDVQKMREQLADNIKKMNFLNEELEKLRNTVNFIYSEYVGDDK